MHATMNTLLLYVVAVMTACCGLAAGGALYRPEVSRNMDESKVRALFDSVAHPGTSLGGMGGPGTMADDDESEAPAMSWFRYLMAQNKMAPTQAKRFTSFSAPYFKYQNGKRNNGVWIWMPAQGYVSVPKQQQDAFVEDGTGKPGKIMRYGK